MKFCTDKFIETNEEKIFFEKHWKFKLSNFQQWSIRGILNKKHVLITAHTGSGKTLPAEAAIAYFTSINKKVIYTSPIKALTNQKYKEFSDKFPDLSFGIFTGDNKHNPEADVLLMTAEILRNTLFQKKMLESGYEGIEDILTFDINMDEDIGCIIMDEAHYINDLDRGKVWEETIILANKNIQLLLLSATLSKPELLASLIERRGGEEVYICSTKQRLVPLSHEAFITIPDSSLKKFDTTTINKYLSMINKTTVLRTPDNEGGDFKEKNLDNLKNAIKFIKNNKIRSNKFFVLNEIVKYVKNNELLPAIMFVFSRKQVNIIAEKIQIPLLSPDSKVPSIINKECIKLLKSKLPNWQDYTRLPEYEFIIKLLEKGIAIHHAGILKEFREMIELIFDKGYIKLLIATETFAVGINMPTKTTIFTSLEKFDGSNFRYLEPSEYTQMAGRAGRRGLDTRGVVIHACNLFDIEKIETSEYKHILTGPPKSISSKFSLNLNLMLHLLSTTPDKYEGFISKSLMKNDIDFYKRELQEQLKKQKEIINKDTYYKTDTSTLDELYNLEITMCGGVKGKQRKKMVRRRDELFDTNKSTKDDYIKFKNKKDVSKKVEQISHELKRMNDWVKDNCQVLISILCENNFVEHTNEKYQLTPLGKYATCLQEVFSLPFAEAIHNNIFNDVTPRVIASILSCFTNIKLSDENTVYSIDNIVVCSNITNKLRNYYDKYIDIHNINKLNVVESLEFHFNLVEILLKWCDAANEDECKIVLQEAKKYDISLGDFVKAILKINNISRELENVAIIKEDLTLLEKLKSIPSLTLKHCVTNKSLYL